MAEQTPAIHHGQTTRCRSCKAPIVWAYTLGGKRAPFERDDQGEYVIEHGSARHVGPAPQQLELGAPAEPPPPRFKSHFASCPDGDKWRGKK